jgi:outer membrane protein, multidrug efflux system
VNKFIGLLLSMILCGCMLGPNYRRPDVDIPDSYIYETDDAEDTLNTCWWENFGDSVLTDLVEEALANNKNVKIAAANIENAIGIFLQVRAPLFPQIGYSGYYTRMRLSDATASPAPPTNPQTILNGELDVSWQIDIWGRIRRLTESSRASLFATIEARQNVILALVASVSNAYFQLRGFDAQLVIAQETLRSYAQALHYFELQYKHGQVSQMTVAQAKTQVEIAAASIPQIQLQIAQAENALSVLLGRNPGPITRGRSIQEMNLPEVPAGIPSSLLDQRPDILQAEQNLIAANALIGAAKALYFPSITLTDAYGSASEELRNLFTGPARAWNFTGSIMGPIFTWGLITGQVLQAEAQQEAALQSYELTIEQAFADVEDALVAHTMLLEQLAAQKRLVEASGEYVYLSKLQYDGGYSPYFVVLQAQQQLFPSELSWIETRVALFSSVVDIYQAMGGGWCLSQSGDEICLEPQLGVFPL